MKGEKRILREIEKRVVKPCDMNIEEGFFKAGKGPARSGKEE